MESKYLMYALIQMFVEYLLPLLIPLIALYVIGAIGLYKMADKLKYPNAWMAWVPIANLYLMFILPMNRFKVLAIDKEMDRKNAFWIYIGIIIGCAVLTMVPLIGMLFSIGSLVASIFFGYPQYKDLYAMFVEESKVKTFTLLSMLVPGAASIILLIASRRELRTEMDT